MFVFARKCHRPVVLLARTPRPVKVTSALGWMLLLGAIGCGEQLSLAQDVTPPATSVFAPRAAIELKVPVGSVADQQANLLGGWRDGLTVGMVLNLLDEQETIIGQLRLTEAQPNSATGTLIGPLHGTTQAVQAVAPYPLTVTQVSGNTVSFLIPRGNRQLHPGDTLTVMRNGEPIAKLQFSSYRPVSGTITELRSGTTIREGDIAWAYQSPTELPAVASLPSTTLQAAVPAPAQPFGQSVPERIIPTAPSSNGVTPAVPSPRGTVGNVPGTTRPGTPTRVATLPSTDVFASTDIFSGAEPAPLPKKTPVSTRRPATAGAGLTRGGPSGLIRVPSGTVIPDGEVRVAQFGAPPNSRTNSSDLSRLGNNNRQSVAVAFLPRAEIGVAIGAERPGLAAGNKDLTFHGKLQIVKEKMRRPAVAVGIAEIKKNSGDTQPTPYIAASKNLANGRLKVTTGAMKKSGSGIKPFGGAEVGLTKNVSAVVEHDSQKLNYGLRGSFLKDHVRLAAEHIDGGWSLQTGLSVALGNRPTPLNYVQLPQLSNNLADADAIRAVQRRLINLGLENISIRLLRAPASQQLVAPAQGTVNTAPVAPSAPVPPSQDVMASPQQDVMAAPQSLVGTPDDVMQGVLNQADTLADTIEVKYENRSFAHSELDALSNVLATASVYAPNWVKRVSVVVKRSAVPVLRITCPLDDYRRFMNGQLNEQSFATAFWVDQSVRSLPDGLEMVADSGTGASSYGHTDLFLRPGLTTELATERYTLGLGVSLQPEIDLPLGRGINLNARGDIPLAGPLKGEDATYDRLALQFSGKPRGPFLARAFVGRFPGKRDSVLAEGFYRPNNSRLMARASAGYIERNDGSGQQESTLLGEARYYMPKYDLSARFSGGRYIEGDTGVTLGLTRRFGDTEMGLEVRDTSLGRVGLVRLGIPLGPSHLYNDPSAFRVRPPDFFDYSQRSLLTVPNFVDIANRTGNELGVGATGTRALLDRDRLQGTYLLNSLPELRQILPFDTATGAAPTVTLSGGASKK